MPKYPLSSNLLALFSGSFYGTAGPDKKGRHDVRPDEGSKQEETKKTRDRKEERGKMVGGRKKELNDEKQRNDEG